MEGITFALTEHAEKINEDDGYMLKNYVIQANILANRQYHSARFSRVICDGCDTKTRLTEEYNLELEQYEYPRIKSMLQFGVDREIHNSKFGMEKMSVVLVKQGREVVMIELETILQGTIWVSLIYFVILVSGLVIFVYLICLFGMCDSGKKKKLKDR